MDENSKLWYVVNTYSGHEAKVAENLLLGYLNLLLKD